MFTLKTIRTLWILACALALPMAVFSLQGLFVASQSQTAHTLINTDDPLPPGAIRRFGTSRFRHGGWLGGFVFSPDGRVLATTAYDGELRLWDTKTGKQLHRITEYNARAFSPDGKFLAVVHNDGNIYLWHTNSWKKTSAFTLFIGSHAENDYVRLAYSPDGKSLAAGFDTGILLFNLAVPKDAPVFVSAPSDGVYSFRFFPDGKKIFSIDRHNKTRVINLQTKEVRTFRHGGRNIDIARVSKDGNLVAVTGRESNYVHMLDSLSGEKIRSLRIGNWTADLLFLPDNRTLLVCRIDGVLQKWDIGSGKLLWKKSTKNGEPTDYEAISPDGRKLAGGFGKVIRLWDIATGREIIPAKSIEQRLICKSYSAQANLLACLDRKVIRLVDATSGRVTFQIPAPKGGEFWTRFSPDGKTLLVGNSIKQTRVYNVAAGKIIQCLNLPTEELRGCSFSPDHKLLAALPKDYALRLMSIADGLELKPLPDADWVSAPTFSPDGKLLAARRDAHRWDPNAKVRVWDIAGCKRLYELNAEQGSIGDICFSPDSKLLLSAAKPLPGKSIIDLLGNSTGDGSIVVWDAASGKYLHRIENICSGFNRIAFAPDGRTLFAGCQDHQVRLLETATWKERRAFAGHHGPVDFIALSRDKRTIISACAEESILFWNMLGLTKQEKARMKITNDKLEKLWSDLAGADAKRAYRAICLLVANPNQSVTFLTKKLSPNPPPNPATTTRLIMDLDNDKFSVRSRATKELTALHWCAVPALTNALKENQTLERRLRIEKLLQKLRGVADHPKQLRRLRAVEALEYIGTKIAKKLLHKFAGGAEQALLTREARNALQRLHNENSGRLLDAPLSPAHNPNQAGKNRPAAAGTQKVNAHVHK